MCVRVCLVFNLQTVDVMFLYGTYAAGDLHIMSAQVTGNVANDLKIDLVRPDSFYMASWIHLPAQREACSATTFTLWPLAVE